MKFMSTKKTVKEPVKAPSKTPPPPPPSPVEETPETTAPKAIVPKTSSAKSTTPSPSTEKKTKAKTATTTTTTAATVTAPPSLATTTQAQAIVLPKTATIHDLPYLISLLAADPTSTESPPVSASIRKSCAKKIYELCDVTNKFNRIPMVVDAAYSSEKNVLDTVPLVLAKNVITSTGDTRHLLLLALNNLTIPSENKRVLTAANIDIADDVGKELANVVIGSLISVVVNDETEGYLALITLMNLSFLETGGVAIMKHADGDKLLVKIETILMDGSKHPNGEACRWACGLLKNLTRSGYNCSIIKNTDLPRSLLSVLVPGGPLLMSSSSVGSSGVGVGVGRWTSNSLEDFALFAGLYLSVYAAGISVEGAIPYDNVESMSILRPIVLSTESASSYLPFETPLQQVKAVMTLAHIPSSIGSDYPSESVVLLCEAVGNILAKRGTNQNGGYEAGTFKLSTAIRSLRFIIEKVQDDEVKLSIASKLVSASLFQIITSFTLACNDVGAVSSIDFSPADEAVVILSFIAPTLLTSTDDNSDNKSSSMAVSEISSLLSTYGNAVDNASSLALSKQIQKSSSSSNVYLPNLNSAHAAWDKQRSRDGLTQAFFTVIGKTEGVGVEREDSKQGESFLFFNCGGVDTVMCNSGGVEVEEGKRKKNEEEEGSGCVIL